MITLRYGWDERQLRAALKQFARSGVDVFHRELLQRIAAVTTPPPSGTGEPSSEAQ